MFTSITGFLTGARWYVMGGLIAVVLALSVTVYVQYQKVRAVEAEKGQVELALSVSNASIEGLTETLRKVNEVLQAKEKSEKALLLEVQEKLKQQAVSDKKYTDLAAKLRAGPVTEKEIQDAWDVLK